ncbi:MAG TPA: AMP-binding protein, partial [Deltaproteobacteria bacterium]|nr:AMP-binding protein [Deltaproteobacteria bacterium]
MGFERVWHKSYSPDVSHELDFERITMPEALARSARDFPETIALIYMGKKITYRSLDSLVNSFAKVLAGLGVGRGDKVALLLPNIPEVVIATYAAFRIGAVASMNNPLYTEH